MKNYIFNETEVIAVTDEGDFTLDLKRDHCVGENYQLKIIIHNVTSKEVTDRFEKTVPISDIKLNELEASIICMNVTKTGIEAVISFTDYSLQPTKSFDYGLYVQGSHVSVKEI